MSNVITLSVGQYTAQVTPAAQVSGVVTEVGDGPYEISLQYYNQTASFSTRPTIEDGSIGEQPEFN